MFIRLLKNVVNPMYYEQSLNRAFFSTILLASFLLIGCDSNDNSATDSGIYDVVIQPATASIEVGEQEEFSFVLHDAGGNPVQDASVDVRWWSSDSTVFDVNDDGTAIGKDSGSAYCIVEVNELAKTARFVGRDSAFVTVLF